MYFEQCVHDENVHRLLLVDTPASVGKARTEDGF